MASPLRILLIDDNVDDRLLARRELRRQFDEVEVQEAGEATALARALDAGQFDLVVTDYDLQWTDGLTVLRAVKDRFPYCPVIMFTGTGSEEVAVQAMAAGLDDYVVKTTAHFARLPVAMRSALERSRARQAAREAEARARTLIENQPGGVCMLDAEHRVVLMNRVAGEYLAALDGAEVGTALTRIADRGIEEFLVPRDDGLPHEAMCAEPPPTIYEIALNAITEGAEAGGHVLVIRDVTEERKAQQHLEQHNRLAAIGQLAAGIAHDFNNLMTGVVGFAQLLQTKPGMPESAKSRLKSIEEQGLRAGQLVRQILDFGRRSIMQRRLLDLAPLLGETTKMYRRTIPENIRVRLRVEPGEFMILADIAQIQQVITNLALNARDAMPHGGELILELSRLALPAEQPPPMPGLPAGDWVVLSVSDTGVGMRPEVAQRVFEPFFTTKGLGQGTGLGLAQTYGILKQHDGDIHVRSQPGAGTTFTVYLPATSPTQPPKPLAPAKPTPRGEGQTILVVEDEPEVLFVLRDMVHGLNYRVLTAANGREALEIYDQHRAEIALVLTDLTMPEMDGMEMLSVLRKRDPEVKVIALTGYPVEDEGRELLRAGMLKWMQKPPSLTDLAEAVAKALKGSS